MKGFAILDLRFAIWGRDGEPRERGSLAVNRVAFMPSRLAR